MCNYTWQHAGQALSSLSSLPPPAVSRCILATLFTQPIVVEYYQPPEQAQTQPKASVSKKIARPKPTVEEAPPPIVIPDRALRVLRTGESGQIEEEDVDDSFFDVTAAEVKAMLGTAKKLQ